MKQCLCCKLTKPRTDFYKAAANTDGLMNICKECSKLKRKAWYRANKQRHRKTADAWAKRNETVYKQKKRAWLLRNKYGLSEEEYNRKASAQDCKCAICGRYENRGGKLFVDHDHKTRAVRGLLCSKCNTVLGFVNDDVTILVSAIRYLSKHRAP